MKKKLPPRQQSQYATAKDLQGFQQNQQLALIAQQKKNLMAEIATRLMNEELFPTEGLTELFRSSVSKAVMISSPISYQTRLVDFAQGVKIAAKIDSWEWDRKLTISQFQVLANSLDAVSPNSLGLNADEYCLLVDESVSHVTKWGELIKDINDRSAILAEEEWKKQNPPEKANGTPMSIVKGEA